MRRHTRLSWSFPVRLDAGPAMAGSAATHLDWCTFCVQPFLWRFGQKHCHGAGLIDQDCYRPMLVYDGAIDYYFSFSPLLALLICASYLSFLHARHLYSGWMAHGSWELGYVPIGAWERSQLAIWFPTYITIPSNHSQWSYIVLMVSSPEHIILIKSLLLWVFYLISNLILCFFWGEKSFGFSFVITRLMCKSIYISFLNNAKK